jgi:hypothetical protein
MLAPEFKYSDFIKSKMILSLKIEIRELEIKMVQMLNITNLIQTLYITDKIIIILHSCLCNFINQVYGTGFQ